MRKRTIAATALAGALLLPSAAMAERLEYDTPRDESEVTSVGSCTSPVILGKAVTNDEMSANERVMADAWKSHLHTRKARALEGLD
jgi:hypothetical protein